jgi:hypothetical protein
MNELREFGCASNFLTKIDLSKMPNLEHLDCSRNKIAELDLSKVPSVKTVDCSGNEIAALDITNNPYIETLKCDADTKIKKQKGRFVNIIRVEKEPTSDLIDGEQADAGIESIREVECGLLGSDAEQQDLQSELKQLESLVGLNEVKSKLHGLVNLIQVGKLRIGAGLKMPPVSLHLAFSGTRSTAWTAVARITGRIYKALGLLESGHLVEEDGCRLAQDYNVLVQAIAKARHGVLFIEDIGALCASDGHNNFDPINALGILMNHNRGRMAVIIAGSRAEIDRFFAAAPYMRSVFLTNLQFEEYSTGDLTRLFENLARENDYCVDRDAADRLSQIFAAPKEKPDFESETFVKSVFEEIVRLQADRVTKIENPTVDQLKTIILADVNACRS